MTIDKPAPSEVEVEFILVHECPKVVPGLPTQGKHSGRLVACAKCGACVFRDDAWDDADKAVTERIEKTGGVMPKTVEWCIDCQRRVTDERKKNDAK